VPAPASPRVEAPGAGWSLGRAVARDAARSFWFLTAVAFVASRDAEASKRASRREFCKAGLGSPT